MFIINNPKADIYKQLIDLAFDVCDEFVLVVRSDMFYNQTVDYLLEELSCYLKEVKEQFSWPGTFCSSCALVYYYKTDNQAKKIIKEVSNSLHSWLSPDFPEDLSFIKNGEPWLINNAHESESYIKTEDVKEIDRILNIKGLKVKS